MTTQGDCLPCSREVCVARLAGVGIHQGAFVTWGRIRLTTGSRSTDRHLLHQPLGWYVVDRLLGLHAIEILPRAVLGLLDEHLVKFGTGYFRLFT